jgi:hypothetical protein
VGTTNGIIVTFAEASTETVYQYPLSDLIPGNNAGLIRLFNDKEINLPKSYITILDPTNLNIDDAVIFNFIYESVKGSNFTRK